jgi:hypothetical protein
MLGQLLHKHVAVRLEFFKNVSVHPLQIVRPQVKLNAPVKHLALLVRLYVQFTNGLNLNEKLVVGLFEQVLVVLDFVQNVKHGVHDVQFVHKYFACLHWVT